jgi:hypothetical protein
MKTEEDEAFDELARKQGDWGGGFPAKRAMAADKLHWSDCAVHNGPAYPAGECDCGAAQEPVQRGPIPKAQSLDELMNRMNQSLQKADMEADMLTNMEADMLTIAYYSGYHDGKQAALAGREWNFCERCGKRTADLTVIHTCTPPQGGT